MTIHCRVLAVNIEKFSVDLTCRSSDLADKSEKFRWVLRCNSHVALLFSVAKDLYYDYAAAEKRPKDSKLLVYIDKSQSSLSGYIKRVIVHPSFMKVSFLEAQQILSTMEQGDAVFRPSSQVREVSSRHWLQSLCRDLINWHLRGK